MKKFLSIFLILVMVVSLSACASPKNENEPTPPVEKPSEKDKDKDIDNGDNTKDEGEEDEAKKEAEVNIYFTSTEYVVTGNEDLEKLGSKKRKVTYGGDITLEEAVVRELLKGLDTEELYSSIPANAKLIDVEVEGKTVYVNFSKDGMEGSSLDESLAINQLVTSLLDLNTIEKVQFLLDGEISDTLMGNISISEPFDGK